MNPSVDPEILQIFSDEARQTLDDLETGLLALDQANLSGAELKAKFDEVFRHAHNFKGASAAVGFENLAHLAHAIEDLLMLLKSEQIGLTQSRLSLLLRSIDELRKLLAHALLDPNFKESNPALIQELRNAIVDSPPTWVGQVNGPSSPATEQRIPSNREAPLKASEAASPGTPAKRTGTSPAVAEDKSIRVNTLKLDGLLNLIGELVVNQSMMISHRVNGTTQSNHAIQTLTYIEKIVLELQNLAMTLRMVPIKPLFQKMSRIVRDVSVQLGKDVRLETDGDHVELDKIVLDRVTDPLTHIIRNAIDHGLEAPSQRLDSGKAKIGTVKLSAQQQDDKIVIKIRDDGKGLDPDTLKAKAIQKGLITPEQAAKMSEEEAWNLVFLPGFSTKEVISDISGRGVGMDVVQQAVTELKGDIRIRSKKGSGTTFEIALPLSLSIIPGLIISVDQENYVIPVSHLVEIIELQKFDIQTSTQKGQMINLRGEVIPVFSLSSLLHERGLNSAKGLAAKKSSADYRPAIVSKRRGRKFACEVDAVIGQQQIVIKKLGQEFQSRAGILGGAVLSDGEPSMILDLNGLPGLAGVGSVPGATNGGNAQPKDFKQEGLAHEQPKSA